MSTKIGKKCRKYLEIQGKFVKNVYYFRFLCYNVAINTRQEVKGLDS